MLKALLALLTALPALQKLAAQIERLRREHAAARDLEEKRRRNEAALAEAQKALTPEPPEAPR